MPTDINQISFLVDVNSEVEVARNALEAGHGNRTQRALVELSDYLAYVLDNVEQHQRALKALDRDLTKVHASIITLPTILPK